MPINYQQMPGMVSALQAQQGAAQGFKDLAARRAAQAEAGKQRRSESFRGMTDVLSRFGLQKKEFAQQTGERVAGQEWTSGEAALGRKLEVSLQGMKDKTQKDLVELKYGADIRLLDDEQVSEMVLMNEEYNRRYDELERKGQLDKGLLALRDWYDQRMEGLMQGGRKALAHIRGEYGVEAAGARVDADLANKPFNQQYETIMNSMHRDWPGLEDPAFRQENANSLRDNFSRLLVGLPDERQVELEMAFEAYLASDEMGMGDQQEPEPGRAGGLGGLLEEKAAGVIAEEGPRVIAQNPMMAAFWTFVRGLGSKDKTTEQQLEEVESLLEDAVEMGAGEDFIQDLRDLREKLLLEQGIETGGRGL